MICCMTLDNLHPTLPYLYMSREERRSTQRTAWPRPGLRSSFFRKFMELHNASQKLCHFLSYSRHCTAAAAQ